MRTNKSEQYALSQAPSKDQEPETLTLTEFAAKLADWEKQRPKEERRLNPTQEAVIFSPHFFNAYMGAAGAAKTTSLCVTGWMRALFQPGSKGAVCRYDYNKLTMTTAEVMEGILNVLPPGTLLHRDKSPPMVWKIRPIVPGPPSQITFMSLKDSLGSIQLDWAIVDEADEVEEKRISELKMRMRNPLPTMKGLDPYAIFLAFNPPDMTHWLFKACTGCDEKGVKVTEPWLHLFRPGFKENAHNLKEGYYDDLSGLPEDLQQRLVIGDWGAVFPGEPVYRQFKATLHTRASLPYNPYTTLYRFWDFGYNAPACGFAQFTVEGNLQILGEVIGSKVEIGDFITQVFKYQNKRFPHHREFRDYGDPAVKQHKDTGSTLAKLNKRGIQMLYRTSKIEQGVSLTRDLLSRLVEGEPAVLFDKLECPILINAMKGGYRMDERGVNPKKDGFYEHIADAFRYLVLNLYGNESIDPKKAGNFKLPTNLGYGGHYK